MIIKRISIKSFGKIRDKEIEFKEGFNIVYGKNESGKSTIQNFIKAILYGLNVKRGKNLRNNDRVRYLPLDGIKACGEMILNIDEKNIVIERSFGITKKEDRCKVSNNITGEEYTRYFKGEPGKSFLNLNGESFQNTLFIKQLGSGVAESKEDEIITKLSNMLQSGNDKISFQKVKSNLESIKKTLVTTRNNGKLDILRNKYYSLLEEKHKKIKLNEENIERTIKLGNLIKHRDLINNNLEILESSQNYLKSSILVREYEEIQERLAKLKELLIEKQLIDKNLEGIDNGIDIEWLITLKEEIKQYLHALNISKVIDNKLTNIKNKINVQEDIVEDYNNIKKFSDDIEEKIIKIILEEESTENTLNLVIKINDFLKKLENKKQWLEHKLRNHKLSLDMKNDIENNFKLYELKLKKIKSMMNDEKIDLNNNVKMKKINKKIVMMNNSLIIIVITFLISLSKVIDGVKVSFMLIIIMLLIALVSMIILRYKNIKLYEKLSRDCLQKSIIENFNNDIANIEEKLFLYTKELGCEKYEETISLIDEYNNIYIELEKVNKEIDEQKKNFNNLNGSEVLKNSERINKVKSNILMESHCYNLQEFLKFIRAFKQEKDILDILYKELLNEEKIQSRFNNDIYSKEKNIKNKLKQLNLQFIVIENILEKIDEIQNNLRAKIAIEERIKAIEEEYKFLLKDRKIEELKNITINFNKDKNINLYENEKEIEDKIKKNNKDLLKTEKEIKDVEYDINSSTLMTRSLSVIEEEIIRIKLAIDKYEKKVKSIDVALKVLEESFQVMQNSFGPILNKKVAEIFSTLTNGEYSEVKVSSDYNIIVKNKKENSLINVSNLSNGTWDQVYLALRLAIIDLIFKDKTVPIILDESFSQYDEDRLKNALNTLVKLSQTKQIILFTCQKREVNLMEKNENINIIDL